MSTFSVTIQALHVNGKQMTLAVFRQLPTLALFAENSERTPCVWWGIVRYPIKDEGDTWVVADMGGKLFRCFLPEANFESCALRDMHKLEADSKKPKTRYFHPPHEHEVEDARAYVPCAQAIDVLITEALELPQLFIAV